MVLAFLLGLHYFVVCLVQDYPLMSIQLCSSPMKARAGVEMALIDAIANSIRIPLWRLFGGASDSVTTDITVWPSQHPLH